MVFQSFSFESADEDPVKFLRARAPNTILSTVQQAIAFLSMPFPFRNPQPASVFAELERITAVQGSADPKAAMEQLVEKLGEGLDMENLPSSGLADGARLHVREALFACWAALPDVRRNSAEAGQIVRLAITRQIELRREIEQEFLGPEGGV